MIERRTPLKRSQTPLKRTRINPRSKRMQAVYSQRRVLVAELLGAATKCEWPGCPRIATQIHEAWSRARSGDTAHAILCRANCHPMCDEHGSYVHLHEDEAREFGLMRRSHEGCACGHGKVGSK